jgi:hypothetical protein
MHEYADRGGSPPPRQHRRLHLITGHPPAAQQASRRLTSTEAAVLRTLAYADVFDFPLHREEIFRYCFAPGGSWWAVSTAVDTLLARGLIESERQLLFLPGRQETVARRHEREAASQAGRRTARFWARCIAALPFVRMIAITGSLAASSFEPGQDIDYLIVAAPNRLWLVRALCLLTWKLARLVGTRLCPNFLLTTNALAIEQHDLYAARELVQMVPLYGQETAAHMWAANRWTLAFLPNAAMNVPADAIDQSPPIRALKRCAERLLSGRLFDRLETWERTRKITKLTAQVGENAECIFSADVCKHHAHAHGGRVAQLYVERLSRLSLE